MEAEARDMVEQCRSAESTPAEQPAPQLMNMVRSLREQFLEREVRNFELHRELAALEAERQRLAHALDDARKRAADLAGLYVATHRLHSTLDRGKVLLALEEIVASLLGCEEMAVYELIGAPAVLAPVASAGVPPGSLGLVRPGEGVIGHCVVSGTTWVAESSAGEDVPAACVPLRVDGTVTGAIALFRLLDHKGSLEPADIELLDTLATHAGTALAASRLQARCGAAQ